MRIRYISYLHLEFIKPHKIDKFIKNIKPNIEEICVLSGDIGNPYKENYDIFMKYINESFKHIFIIAGNHEYYNNEYTIDEINEYLNEYFKQFENISFLNNTYKIYENYCLWVQHCGLK
jgi:predicted MPP superfamily phosphohydrolase